MRRREFITALGVAMWPISVRAQQSKRIFAQPAVPGPVMNTLSAYMAAAAARALPDEVAEHAKYHLIDTFAAMISGSELPPGQAAQRYIREHGGNGTATVVGSALTAAPLDAVLANGVMAHADETDDSHNELRSHPGCSIVPAALAVGEQQGIDGTGLLRAVTLGYDIGPRVVMAMGGAASATRAALRRTVLPGLSVPPRRPLAPPVSMHARCAGRWTMPRSSPRGSFLAARHRSHREAFVFAGMPARNGVTSAFLVKSGWNGVEDIFSGADNFFAAYAPKAQPARLIEKLGERYEITQTDIKKWTVGFADPGTARCDRNDPQ